MANPFGGAQKWNGSFRAEDASVTFGGIGGPGALVQSVQVTCTRSVNFLYEIGSNNVYYVGDRRQGQANLVKVVGGPDVGAAMGNMCAPQAITVDARGGCGGGMGGKTFTLKDAVLSSAGLTTTAQEVVINEQLGFTFSDLG